MSRFRKRTAAAALVAASMAVPIGLTGATPDAEGRRIAGDDRFGTAAAVALEAFPDGVDSGFLFVANGFSFPDALAGNALAGLAGAPLLLTGPEQVPAVSIAAASQLLPFAPQGQQATIVLLGGQAVISAEVGAAIAALGLGVGQLGGANRYETAAGIANAFVMEGGTIGQIGGKRTAIVANGLSPADSLAIGPLSYHDGLPLLLTRPESLPAPTAAALAGLEIEQVIVVGGTAAVSEAVASEIEGIVGSEVIRLAGSNRYETATVIADFLAALWGAPVEVLLANGDDDRFADALAAGPLGGTIDAPILLTGATLPPATAAWIAANSGTIRTVTAIGGRAAVPDAALDAAVAAARGL